MSKRKSFLWIAAGFLLGASFLLLNHPPVRSVLGYLKHPQLIAFYIKNPAMRDLFHLVAEDRLRTFHTVWDTTEGVFLSKQMFRPVEMEGHRSYAYLPNLKKLSFETGVPGFTRRFEAVDTPRLRAILQKLDTPVMVGSSFNTYGFRSTSHDFEADCSETVLFTGDSFTEGLWVSDRENFPSLFADGYARDVRNGDVCVVNAGTNGYGIFEESFIARTYFPIFRFRTLFVIPYPNDIAPDVFGVLTGAVPDLDILWKEYFSTLKKLSEFARQNQIRMVLAPIPPKEQFAVPETKKNYQEKLASFCAENGIEFWDPFETFVRSTWEEIYLDWDPHLNASGHRILAEFLKGKALTSTHAKL